MDALDDILKKIKQDETRSAKKKKSQLFEPPSKQKKKGAQVTSKPKSSLALFREKKKLSAESVSAKLRKPPAPDKDKPHLYTAGKNVIHQADLLYLPEDEGYKYLLVVVDTATRLTDAAPLRDRKATDAVAGFKQIYNKPKSKRILSMPKLMIQVDSGAEFKGKPTQAYFNKSKVVMRFSKPGRSRQQSYVESHNALIGEMVGIRQGEEEDITGEAAREWVEDLPLIIEALNERLQRAPFKVSDVEETPVCKGQTCELLPKGTRVRPIAEKPKDGVTGKPLAGGFRKGDIRWEKTTRTIAQQILKPGNPPLYRLSGLPKVAYTKNQLQVVSKDEKAPSTKAQSKFVVERLVEKRKKRGKVEFLVKWRGYPTSANTWEPRQRLIKDVPDLVKTFGK